MHSRGGARIAGDGGGLRRSSDAKHCATESLTIPAGSSPDSAASTSRCLRPRWSAWRRRAVSGRVSVRMRGAEGIARAGAAARRRSRRRLHAAGHGPVKDASGRAADVERTRAFQCTNGGFAYWPGACWSASPYLTAYLLHVFKMAADLKYTVDPGMRDRAYRYLDRELAQRPPSNEGWWPSYTAWQAFAVKVLVEGGRNAGFEHQPPVRLSGSHAGVCAGVSPRRAACEEERRRALASTDLRRRMSNAILPEGEAPTSKSWRSVSALVLEFKRAVDGIVLNTLVKADAPRDIDCDRSSAG